jgi:hypothetical protein
VPISTQLPAAEWLCDFCTAAVSAAARARQRDEDEEAARDANKRQRGAPPPAAQAAAHDTLARLEESLLRNADTRGELADTRELMVDELARFKAAARNKVSADHGLARCRAGGVLWAGRLSFVVQVSPGKLRLWGCKPCTLAPRNSVATPMHVACAAGGGVGTGVGGVPMPSQQPSQR